ncbi:MAG: O-antigen ligase family protein [Candidatus Omnitrophica bacterium]|nr:O-antigen ligase family protein [Candidatus Omnitrophota bacterium]MDD5311209.1 O-antigen ligase family protein [Candidatus Omnitrophota bacterium]MDD5546124.1 O-antigen ligase family protein [Candidatus Omnitrophota bacterium]
MSDKKENAGFRNIAFSLLICAAIGALSAVSGLLPLRFVLTMGAGLLIVVGSLFFRDKKLYYLTLLVFFLPININKAIFRIDSPIPSLGDVLPFYATDAFLAVLYGLWIYSMAHSEKGGRRIIWMTPVMFLMFAMVAADILSLVNAVRFDRSFIEIAMMVKAVLVYFYFINNINSMKEIKVIVATLAVGLILQTAIVIMQVYFRDTLGLLYLGELKTPYLSYEEEHQIFRPSGLFGHPNLFSNYLEFLIPLMFAMSFVRRNVALRRLATVAMFAGGFSLIYTLSRGGWVGVVVASFLLFFIVTARNIYEQKFFFKTLLIVLLAVGILAAFSPKIIKRVVSRDRGAAAARVSQFYVAAEIITAHPLVGVGINNYVEVMESYDETTDRISRAFKFPIHTVYLEYYAETGLLGIVSLLSLFFVIVATSIGNIRRSKGFLFNLNVGLLFGFIAYAIHCVSDMNYPSRLTVFAFFAALSTIANYAIRDRITLADE